MARSSYTPKDGDFAGVIEELGQKKENKLRREALSSIKAHAAHARDVPKSFEDLDLNAPAGQRPRAYRSGSSTAGSAGNFGSTGTSGGGSTSGTSRAGAYTQTSGTGSASLNFPSGSGSIPAGGMPPLQGYDGGTSAGSTTARSSTGTYTRSSSAGTSVRSSTRRTAAATPAPAAFTPMRKKTVKKRHAYRSFSRGLVLTTVMTVCIIASVTLHSPLSVPLKGFIISASVILAVALLGNSISRHKR